ncbi:cell surface protein [Candidatus Soleaferrea massiliensis]|uniref:phage major capsid protein n=1 Tax=Candidatus Soleaferrea massiliensis TaxID=1470354 RepID=UPI000590DEF6|nr:cell surface protein [Candidatus Soleaferrea massiliensis]
MEQYQNIPLERSMYHIAGKSFSQVLEEQDPSDRYKGTPLAGLDAFQRQLKRFDIRVGSSQSDKVEKFFSTSSAAVLFPEYIARAVRQGIEQTDYLSEITATRTMTDSLDYRSILVDPDEDEKELKIVAEGAAIPATYISLTDHLIRMNKHGRMLVASYEAVKYQRLDLFTVSLRQIGNYICKSQLKDAVDVLINGHDVDTAAQAIETQSGGALCYADLLTLWDALGDYEMNVLLASPDMMLKLLSIEEFKDPRTGLNFQGSGRLSTPMGASLIRSDAVPQGTLIGLDKRFALEMVAAGDVLVENDKLIDRQLDRTAVSTITGFAKICPQAVKMIQLTQGGESK